MEVRTLGGADVDRAGGVIARAFFDDPLNVHLFPDDEVRARLAPSMFAAYVRLDQLFGCVEYLGEFAAVASWVRPGEVVETPERLARAGFWDLHDEIPLDTLDTVFAFIGSVVEEVAPEPHWHLRLLGVEPDLQSRGLGTVLVRHGVARATATRHPILLETFSERNVPFYVRNGFDVLTDRVERSSGVRFWALRRAG